MADNEWYLGYMKRHQRLSLRKPEATSIGRVSAFNESNVKAFFENYQRIANIVQLHPSRLWNIDETGVTTVHKPQRVVCRRGRKQIGQVTSGERGTLVSLAVAVSAAGQKGPIRFIFPRVHFQDHFLHGGPAGCTGGANPSGWMNSKNFLLFMKELQTFTGATVDHPIVVFLDNHESHRALPVLEFCKTNGMHLISFPPHCSHKLQPLDVSVFQPFKAAVNKLCAQWMRQNAGKAMSITDIPSIVDRALQIGVSEANIVAGFKATGIWPRNDLIFNTADFLPSKTTDRPLNLTPSCERVSPVPAALLQTEIKRDVDKTASPGESVFINENSFDALSETLTSILPHPKAAPRKRGTRGRKPGRTLVLTDDNVIAEIKVENEKKQEREAKKMKKQCENPSVSAKRGRCVKIKVENEQEQNGNSSISTKRVRRAKKSKPS